MSRKTFAALALLIAFSVSAGAQPRGGTVREAISLIHEAGFDAAQRTTKYEILKRFPAGQKIDSETDKVSESNNSIRLGQVV